MTCTHFGNDVIINKFVFVVFISIRFYSTLKYVKAERHNKIFLGRRGLNRKSFLRNHCADHCDCLAPLYLRRVNGVNGGDTVFVRCVFVCVSAQRSGQSHQFKTVKATDFKFDVHVSRDSPDTTP